MCRRSHDEVNTALQMRQDKHNNSGVGKFVRKGDYCPWTVITETRNQKQTPPRRAISVWMFHRCSSTSVFCVPTERGLLFGAGCCYLAKRKTRTCVKSAQVFLQNKSRHRSQTMTQYYSDFQRFLVEFRDWLPCQTHKHCKNCVSGSFRRVYRAHRPGLHRFPKQSWWWGLDWPHTGHARGWVTCCVFGQ